MTKRTWKPKTEMDFAALHESGHAIVAAAAGCAVNRVVATQEGEARIGLTDYHLPLMSSQAARAMEIGILCGGKAAENDLGGRQSSRGILQDQRDIRNQLDQLQALGSLDFTEEEILSHCEKRAHELIQLNKHAVLKLAGLLSKEGIVEGSQLQAILSEVRVPKC